MNTTCTSCKLPPRCVELLADYKYAFTAYMTLRQMDKKDASKDLRKEMAEMRKDYLMKCPIPDIGFPPKLD